MRSQHAPDYTCPTGLMGGTAAAPGFPVKIFVEQDQTFPVWIGGVSQVFAVAGPVTFAISQKKTDQPADDLVGHLL